MRHIDMHIIHCSDTPEKMDIGFEEIDAWHKERGWSGCGYHYIIRRDGKIEAGRSVEHIGAHARGHNNNSIGTCLVGRNKFTDDQFKSLNKLHNILSASYPNMEVLGHRDVDGYKTCPNFEVKEYI